MPKKSMELLTETMFYVLMAFCKGAMCGIDVAEFIEKRTGGRILIGPATLYTILGKFEKEKYIAEVQVEGSLPRYFFKKEKRSILKNILLKQPTEMAGI